MAEIESVVEPDGVGNDIGWGAPSRNRWRLYVFMGQFYRNQPVKLSVPILPFEEHLPARLLSEAFKIPLLQVFAVA